MKNIFKFLGVFLLGAMAFLSINAFSVDGSNTPQSDVMLHLSNVKKIESVHDAIVKLDTTQLSICDTCFTSYVSAIQENRALAVRLTTENEKLGKAIFMVKSKTKELEKKEKIIDRMLSRLDNKIVEINLKY